MDIVNKVICESIKTFRPIKKNSRNSFNRLVNELRLSLRQPGDFRPTLVELAKLLLSKGGPSLARSMVPFLPEGARDAFRRTVNAAVS